MRYPKAKHTGVSCYHYGWVRTEEQMNLKSAKIQKYWGERPVKIDYSQIDQSIIKEFQGSHPEIVRDWHPAKNIRYKSQASLLSDDAKITF